MSTKVEGIYVSLDSLLDTRIGTVAKEFGDAMAIEVLKDGYHARQDDAYPAVQKALDAKAQEAGILVDEAAFKRMYASRNAETLKLSAITNIPEMIVTTVLALMEQAIESPYYTTFKLTVNTYPYELSDEEMTAISEAVAEKLGNLTKAGVPLEIETVYLPLAAITPTYCKHRFAALIMYDYAEWVDLHAVGLKKLPIPEISLITPAIYHEKSPTLNELRETLEELSHPMHLVYEMLKPYVRLELIDISYFSLVDSPNQATA